jgi:Zn-finger nucleic acid-binding protein
METETVELIQVELKYCERCGGLWLRRQGSEQVYCASCEPFMAALPRPALKRPVGCVSRHDIEALADEFAVCCAEGQA